MAHVHALIRHLSKQEKRYFKLFADRHRAAANNNYLLLFDQIHAQEVYDEPTLRKKNKGARWEKNFANTKYELYHLILRSLHAYHASRSQQASISVNLHQASILYDKGLFKQSAKLLDKIERLAESTENHRQHLLILEMKEKVARQSGTPIERESRAESIHDTELEILQKLRFETQMQRYFSHVQGYMLEMRPEKRKENQARMQRLLDFVLAKKPSDISFRGAYLYHDVRATCHHQVGDLATAVEESYVMIEGMEAQPDLLSLHRDHYVRALTKVAIYLLESGQLEGAPAIIAKMRAMQDGPANQLSRSVRLRLFLRLAMLEMLFYIERNQFDQSGEMETRLREGFAEFGEAAPPAFRIILGTQLAWMHLGNGQPALALPWVNEAIDGAEKKLYTGFHSIALVLHLIIHFELGNYEILPSLARSAYRSLKQIELLTPVEHSILKVIREDFDPGNRKHMVPRFKQLQKEFKEHFELPEVASRFRYFDFRIWLKAKISGKPMGK